MDFIELLQAAQQFGVVCFELLGHAQQNHVFGGPVAGKIVELARGGRLCGRDQRIHQAAAGLQNKARFVATIAPIPIGPLGRVGFEGQSRFLCRLGNVPPHPHVRHQRAHAVKRHALWAGQKGHQYFALEGAVGV